MRPFAQVGHRPGGLGQVVDVQQLEAHLLRHHAHRAVRQRAARCTRRAPAPRRAARCRVGSCRGRASARAGRCSPAAPPRAWRSPRSRRAAARGAGPRAAPARVGSPGWAGSAGRPSVANSGPRCARSSSISRAARRDGGSRASRSVTRRRAPPRSPRVASRGSRRPFSMSDSWLPASPPSSPERVQRQPPLGAQVPDAAPQGDEVVSCRRSSLHPTKDQRFLTGRFD